MKKRYLAVAIIIAVILLLPKYIASQVSNTITTLVANVNNIPVYTAEVVEINEGWFSSNAIIKVGIDFDNISTGEIANMPTGKVQFLVDFKSSHGPLIIADGFAVAMVKWHASYSGNEFKPAMQWDHTQAFYQINGIQQLWNSSQFQDEMQPFTIDNAEHNIQADFSGYKGNGTYSSDHFDYAMVWDKVTIENPENAALIANTELEMSVAGSYLEAMQGKLFDTNIAMKIGQFQLNDLLGQSETMNLLSTNLEMVAKVDDNNATTNIEQLFTIDSATFNGYLIQDLKMDLALNQLSVEFLEKYQKMANQLGGKDPAIAQQELIKFAQDNLLELLSKNPELNFKDISATLPEGKFDINAKAQTLAIAELPDDLQDSEFWLSHIMAEANLSSDKAVAEMFATNYLLTQLTANPQTAEMSVEQINQIAAQQAPAMLDALMQQGFIVEENGVYKAAATLKDKKMVLNGKEIPLPF